jgi:hypothetical protein
MRPFVAVATVGRSLVLFLVMGCLSLAPALAADGVIEINQARALAGGVTPGDTAGFPVTISVSGSYRLTGNLDVTGQPTPQNVTAISVVAGATNVTIDLNGFAIIGPESCSGTPIVCTPGAGGGDGINSAAFGSITVKNGIVRGMGRLGVVVSGDSLIEGVHAISNVTDGIYIDRGVVRGCVAESNGAFGIITDGTAVVAHNVARANGSVGIEVAGGAVSDNTAVGNGGDGVFLYTNSGLASFNQSSGNGGYALHLNNTSGYLGNVMGGTTTVNGGTNLGQNLCNGVVCP